MILKKIFGKIDSVKAFYIIAIVALLMAWTDYMYTRGTEFLAMALIDASGLFIFSIRNRIHTFAVIMPISFYYCWILMEMYRNGLGISIFPLSLCMIALWALEICPESKMSYNTWTIANIALWMDWTMEMGAWDHILLQQITERHYPIDIMPYIISGVLRLNFLLCFFLSTMMITKPESVKWNEDRFQNAGFMAFLLLFLWAGISIIFGVHRSGGLILWNVILLLSFAFVIFIAISIISETTPHIFVKHHRNSKDAPNLDYHSRFIYSRWAYSVYDEEKVLLLEKELRDIEDRMNQQEIILDGKATSEYNDIMERKSKILFILEEIYNLL